MPKAIVVKKYGGPEVLQLENIPSTDPNPEELLIQQTAAGINFHDIYCRSGLYKTLALPGIPGIEGVGKILKLGTDVNNFSVGQRVAYVTGSYGGYASERTIPAAIAVPVPDAIEDNTGASTILKGLTVEMLTNQVTKIRPNDWLLIHAAYKMRLKLNFFYKINLQT